MSKFQLPTQKGTELSPRVTQPPTKVRFEGVPPGSELAQELYRRFAPQINGFHRQQAQKYSLSLVENYRAHARLPGLQLTYTNLQGHETVDVRIEASAVGNASRSVGRVWDWALIEVQMPNADAGVNESLSVKAYRRIPAPTEVGQKFEGFAFGDGEVYPPDSRTYWSDGLTPLRIGFAPGDAAFVGDVVLPAGSTQIASLRVDLRQLPPAPVVIDLYATLNATASGTITYGYSRNFFSDATVEESSVIVGSSEFIDDPGPGAHYDPDPNIFWPYAGAERAFWYTNHGSPVTSEDLSYAPTHAYLPGFALPGTPEYVTAPAPEMVAIPNPGSFLYEEQPRYHSPSGLLAHALRYTFQVASTVGTTWTWEIVTQDVTYTITPLQFVGDGPAVAERNLEVHGLGGFGAPDWAVSRETILSTQWQQWEFRSRYPARPQVPRLGEYLIRSVAVLGLGYQHIGTVTIDPVHQSIAFVPA